MCMYVSNMYVYSAILVLSCITSLNYHKNVTIISFLVRLHNNEQRSQASMSIEGAQLIAPTIECPIVSYN